MITCDLITIRRGGRLLLSQASASVKFQDKIGLVGNNGYGKSSLFQAILNPSILDEGEILIKPKVSMAEVSQEFSGGSDNAIEYVMQGNLEVTRLRKQLKASHDQSWLMTGDLHNNIYELDGYRLEHQAAKVMSSLGFKVTDYQKPVSNFSGGWQMRLNLARVILSDAEILLLDEPTNYLDLDAIIWLEDWLQRYRGTLMLISHDRDFLDNVVNKVIAVENLKLVTYRGNYSAFEQQLTAKTEHQHKQSQKQQEKIDHLTKYVARFRAKASKARQAQSRLKMLEKINKVDPLKELISFDFSFFEVSLRSGLLVSLEEVKLVYQDQVVLDKLEFRMMVGDSVGLLGANGAGKSTLIKALIGFLQPSAGKITYHPRVKTGYFSQHLIEQLRSDESPLEHLLKLDSKITHQQARSFLGSFGFVSERVFEPIVNFSGGEKARLALAILVWQRPNLLLLDEPTNHLDLKMRESLIEALKNYRGAVVLVSHDRYLLRMVAKEFYLVDEQRLNKLAGGLEEYQRWLNDKKQLGYNLKSNRKTTVINKPFNSLRGYEKQLKALENTLATLERERTEILTALAKIEIYRNGGDWQKIKEYVERKDQCEQKIKQLEEQWLELQTKLSC
jgi:ATPase components of ABC transporters with duplicated ATPase domains